METILLNAHDYPAQAYTVFFDRAEAKREFTGIKLAKGLNEVTIENLPPTLQEDYLGVDGKGPALIVDVRCSSQYSKSEDTSGSESAQRLQTLQKQKKQIDSQIEMLRSKEDVLKEVLVAFAGSDRFDFSGGIDSYDQKKLEVRVKREELEEELADVEKKIREIGLDVHIYSEHQVTGKTVKVTLEAEAACEVSLTITTIMENVTFTPHYTLRAVSSGTESSLKIRYHARISNTSGEDWNDVSLSISTAQASETTVVPRLSRWTVDFQSPAPQQNYIRMASKSKSLRVAANFGTRQDAMLYRQAAPPMPAPTRGGGPPGYGIEEEVDMVTAAAEVSEGITSTFMISGKQTLKDGEKSHTVVIRDLVLEGKFANICVPKSKEARVKNSTDYPLLPGEVAIFLDGAFVGKTEFAYVSPGEYLNVCLGVDKGITVKYHPRQIITSKRGIVLAKSTVQGYSQLITVRNLKSTPLQKLTIMDQIPVSEDKSIIVNLISPPKEQLINIADKDSSSSGFTAMANTSKGSVRMSISEKGGEKERDKILWNPDTGRVTWDFIDVKEKKTVEIKLEWEVVSGGRSVYSHFGEKI